MFAIDEVLFSRATKFTRVVTASDEAHVRKPLREIADKDPAHAHSNRVRNPGPGA